MDQLKEAMLYEKQSDGSVLCRLCPHRCLVENGKRGSCAVRENRAGTMYTLAYNHLTGRNVDSVEKKPLFHFYPGSTAYSISAFGCNFRCQYCTNWAISQVPGARLPSLGEEVTPEQVVSAAVAARCHSIAYTYVEPTIFFEYVYDTSRLAQAAGLANIYKTNGFMTDELVDSCSPYLDAANVDLKAFRDTTYQRFGGRLQPVLDALKRMKELGVWLEVTTVIIPGVNDDTAELKDVATFIADELGVNTPWHTARFFPAYKMADVLPTPVNTLRRAREIGLAQGLNYIYFGNLPEKGSQDTVCVECNAVLIQRRGFNLLKNNVCNSRCHNCGALLPGVGMGGTVTSKLL
jgi:pyruvate formate lyase activating enzyme